MLDKFRITLIMTHLKNYFAKRGGNYKKQIKMQSSSSLAQAVLEGMKRLRLKNTILVTRTILWNAEKKQIRKTAGAAVTQQDVALCVTKLISNGTLLLLDNRANAPQLFLLPTSATAIGENEAARILLLLKNQR